MEINFMDQGFLLAMPIFGDCMHNLCSQLQQHHAWLLTSKSKRFAQGPTLSRAFSVLLIGAYQLHVSGRRHLPIDKCNGRSRNLHKVAPRNLEAFALK